MGVELTVDVVSDIVCPWCMIGARRLESALADAKDVTARVTFHPFLLDPSIPPEGVDLRERLRAKYGMEPARMFERVEAAARESGIPLDFAKVKRMPSTLRAHALVRRAEGQAPQPALARALFDAYFFEEQDVGDADTLAAIGAKHGFDAADARRIVTDDAELAATRAEAREAAAQGITGVPFFVFAGKYAMSGAQPMSVFRQAIARATQG